MPYSKVKTPHLQKGAGRQLVLQHSADQPLPAIKMSGEIKKEEHEYREFLKDMGYLPFFHKSAVGGFREPLRKLMCPPHLENTVDQCKWLI